MAEKNGSKSYQQQQQQKLKDCHNKELLQPLKGSADGDQGGGAGGSGAPTTSAAGMAAAADPKFGCTTRELKELMEIRGLDAVARIRSKYGAMDELCRRLEVSPHDGLQKYFYYYYLLIYNNF